MNRSIQIIIATLLALPFASSAITLTFESKDIADADGKDWRQGIIHLSETISKDQGFVIYFPVAEFLELKDGKTDNIDWSILTLADGLGDATFDALSIVALAEVKHPFYFSFVYAENGTPSGEYDFELYDNNDFEGDPIFLGTTLSVATGVPEVFSTGWVLGLTALGLFSFYRRRT